MEELCVSMGKFRYTKKIIYIYVTPAFLTLRSLREYKHVWIWQSGGKTGYSNAFFDEGRSIIWFGGSRMTRGKKLCKVGILFIIHSSREYSVVLLRILICLSHRITCDSTSFAT